MSLIVEGTSRLRRIMAAALIALLLTVGFVASAEGPSQDKTLSSLMLRLDNVKDENARQKVEREILAAARARKPADGQAKPILEALSGRKSSRAKDSLFRVLGDLADPASLEVLTTAAMDGNLAAVEALGKWPEIEPEATLYELAKRGPSAAVKEKALDGYINILRLPHETPAEKTIARLKEALGMATTLAQKRASLAGLSELPSEASLTVVEQYLDDADVGTDAKTAAARIRSAG